MRYEWELDIDVIGSPSGHGPLSSSWHLKKVWDKDPLEDKFAHPLRGVWKVSVAWVNKVSDRKYHLRFAKGDNDKTFRSLKAAKAYAVAIITLEGT
jgi:hypothetical protein